jgi:hypothetical protein
VVGPENPTARGGRICSLICMPPLPREWKQSATPPHNVGERHSNASMAGWGDSPLPQGLRTSVERLSHISYSTSSLRILSTSSTCDKDVSIPASARQRLGHPVRWLASPQEEADLQWIELLLVYKAYSCSPLRLDLHPHTGPVQ